MKKILLFLAAAFCVNTQAQVCFNSSAYTLGTNSTITDDFNKDGKPDIATADYSNNRVCVGINTGTGSFSSTCYTVGTDPLSITSADFNNDGYPDLAVANENGTGSGSSSLSVLINTGTGSFGTASSLISGVNPYTIISADFDKNGNVDLAVADYTSNDISVYLGTGTGSFAAPTSYSVFAAMSLTSADFNNDGNLDLVATHHTNNTNLTLLLGNGNGTFGTPTNTPISNGGYFLISADFNGDGNMDVASDGLSVLLGTGAGSFLPEATYIAGSSPWGITSADFNGDSKLDLAVSNYGSNNVSILLGTGTGNFGTATNFTISANSRSITSADFNLDGKLDLATNTSKLLSCTPTASCVATVTVNATSASICTGSSTTLTATGLSGSTFNWVPATGLNVTTGSVVVASPTTAVTYTVIGNTATCSPGWASSSITINPTPTISVTNNSYTICAGAQATLTASGASNYTWTPAATLSNANVANPVAVPTTTTVYSVTATDANGCASSTIKTVTVTVNQPPSTPILFGTSNPVLTCVGNTLSLLVRPTGPPSYPQFFWYNGSTMVQNDSSYIPPTNVAGTTVYNVIESYLCNSAPLTVTVIVNPTPTVSILAPGSVCSPACITYSANVSPANQILTYQWELDNGWFSTVANPGPACYPVGLNTIHVQLVVTDANGCTDTATKTISVTPSPSLSVQTTNVNCSSMCNGSATVTVSNGVSPYNFVWAPFGGGTTGTSITSIESNLCAGIYSCVVTDVNNCSDTISVTITQPPALVATYTLVQDTAPHTWDIYSSFSGGVAPYTYNWNWGDGSANSTAPNPTHTYSVAGTYSICVTLTDANGCTDTACQNDAVFRQGSNSTYSSMVYVNVKSGTPGALAYQNLLADSVTEFDINVPCYAMKQGNPQVYSNCVNTSTYVFSTWYAQGDSAYNGKQYKKIIYNNTFQGLMREDTTTKKVYFIQYCNTTEDLLYDFSLTQGGTINYNFPASIGYMPSGTYTVDSVKIQHDYASYYHKHFYLCNHSSANNPTLEMVEGVGNVIHPLFLYYDFQHGILNTSPICPAAGYSEALSCKYNNGIKVYTDSLLHQITTAQMNGWGGYLGTDSCNYCMGFAGGINQLTALNNITIYPNPVKNSFVLETALTEKQTLFVFDVTGKQVLTQVINGTTTIDASNLNAGVYSLSLISNMGTLTKKLVIVK